MKIIAEYKPLRSTGVSKDDILDTKEEFYFLKHTKQVSDFGGYEMIKSLEQRCKRLEQTMRIQGRMLDDLTKNNDQWAMLDLNEPPLPRRHYYSWSDVEKARLSKKLKDFVAHVACEHERTESAIECRIKAELYKER